MDALFLSVPAALSLSAGIVGVLYCDAAKKASTCLVWGIIAEMSAAVALIVGISLSVDSAGANIILMVCPILYIIGAVRAKIAARREIAPPQTEGQLKKYPGRKLIKTPSVWMIVLSGIVLFVALMLLEPGSSTPGAASRIYINKNLTNEQLEEMVDNGKIPANTGWLELDGNQISDLTPLESLKDLQMLILDDNQISDLSPLSSLTNLPVLGLDSNQISDLSPLSSLTNLQSLGLDNNQISNLTPLHLLTNLTSLGLYENQISDLTPLTSLTNLQLLSLYNNSLTDKQITALLKTLPGCQLVKPGMNITIQRTVNE